MINFPLYGLRKYENIHQEGIYKVINTSRTRFVLDVDIPVPSYVDRRLEILRDSRKPYPLYPLSETYESISDMLLSKTKLFIDGRGKILHWKPKLYYPVVCHKVKSFWYDSRGRGTIEVEGMSTKFKVSDPGAKYVQVVRMGRRNVLFAMTYTWLPNTRKKL